MADKPGKYLITESVLCVLCKREGVCVMGESLSRRARASKGLKEHLFLKSELTPFGRAVVALWPDNAPKIIAERAGISVRNANQVMRGERKVTARMLVIVMDEID